MNGLFVAEAQGYHIQMDGWKGRGTLISKAYDVIVIGAGSMGMSAGYYLASQGARTLLIDAFDPPHHMGSHYGDSRLMRHAYTGSDSYTAMALRADELWTDLEQLSGRTLLVRSGVLNMAEEEGGEQLERPELLSNKLERAAQFGIPVETLQPREIRRRWPGLTTPDTYVGLYEKNAGYLLSEACVLAYRQQALAHGAVLLTNTLVTDIEPDEASVTVRTAAGTYTAGRLILSLGAWFGTVNDLITLPIRSVRKAIAWFEADESLFDSSRFPGFTFHIGGNGYYGFPSIQGSGIKIGRHDAGQTWKPGDPFEPFGHYPEDEDDLRYALERFMPRAAGPVLKSAVCKYEMTPDEDFIIDRHPAYGHIYLAGGFSGHGFKFASVVGEILADLALKDRTTQDITPFALSRFERG